MSKKKKIGKKKHLVVDTTLLRGNNRNSLLSKINFCISNREYWNIFEDKDFYFSAERKFVKIDIKQMLNIRNFRVCAEISVNLKMSI